MVAYSPANALQSFTLLSCCFRTTAVGRSSSVLCRPLGGGRVRGLEHWLGLATGQFPPAGFEPQCGKHFSLRNFGNSVYPALPVSFGVDTKSRRSLLSGVYARGSKRSHQSALECVTVVDSTSHSKLPQSASIRRKTLSCTEKEGDFVALLSYLLRFT